MGEACIRTVEYWLDPVINLQKKKKIRGSVKLEHRKECASMNFYNGVIACLLSVERCGGGNEQNCIFPQILIWPSFKDIKCAFEPKYLNVWEKHNQETQH